jgi:hypothetical protein
VGMSSHLNDNGPTCKTCSPESVVSTLLTEVVTLAPLMCQRPSSSTEGHCAEQNMLVVQSLHFGDKAMPLSHWDLKCVRVIWNAEHGLLALPLAHPPTHHDMH